LSKLIPWAVFDRLVGEHGADFRVRKLSTKQQFLALLFAQLSGAESLRDIEGVFTSHAARLYHAGAVPVTRSTLADANRTRSPEVFTGLFAYLAGKAQARLARAAGEAVRLIDSTAFRLSALSSDWAAFSAHANGVKLHTVYDPDASCPLYAAITPARVNDITPAKEMPLDPMATYVFDLGYYDYA
jgi:Domain of unknown function (DUF4372)/Transposase DDE domain